MKIIDKMDRNRPGFDYPLFWMRPRKGNRAIYIAAVVAFVLAEVLILSLFFQSGGMANGKLFTSLFCLLEMTTVVFLILLSCVLADRFLLHKKAEKLVDLCNGEFTAALEMYTAANRYALIQGVLDELNGSDITGFSAGDRIVEYVKNGKKSTVHISNEIPVSTHVQETKDPCLTDETEIVFQNDCIVIRIVKNLKGNAAE